MMPFGLSPSPAHHVKRLQQKRDTITALVDALESYLAFEIDADLESFEKMSAQPTRPIATPEMLANAQLELERMEAQTRQLETMRDNFPEHLAPMFDSLQSVFGNLMGGSIERQRETVKMLQNSLDGKVYGVICERGAHLLEDGTTQHRMINPAEMFQGTVEECEAKARECGWIVDGDKHTCPECAAK